MSCNFADCQNKNENLKLATCWVCENSFHGACVGLDSQIVDALQSELGLKWTCSVCKAVDLEAVKTVREARIEFSWLRSELTTFSNKFNQLEDRFGFLKDQKISSSKTKKNTKKPTLPKTLNTKNKQLLQPESSLAATTPVGEENTGSNSNNFTTPNGDFINLVDSPSVAPKKSSKKTTNSHLFGSPSDSEGSPSYSQVLRVNSALANGMHAEISSQAGPSNQNAPKKSSQVSKSISKKSKRSADSGAKTSRSAKSLTFVDRKKFIFVSRLAADTHADDVKAFVTNKLEIENNSHDINVVKLNSLYKRNIASFKIGAPAHLFDKILDGSFWPSKAIVHEFEFRAKSNEIAVLNTGEAASKN